MAVVKYSPCEGLDEHRQPEVQMEEDWDGNYVHLKSYYKLKITFLELKQEGYVAMYGEGDPLIIKELGELKGLMT